ncbi:site-specific integrase [Staphylococcus felis]|uniref:site-specific integrase n=1 Tax=Staphylococcus felis TaxID=46127 RepID=UPI0039674634
MVAYKDPKTNKWYFQVAVKNENGKWVTKKRRGFDKKKEALQAEQEFLKRLKEEKLSHKTSFKKIAEDYMNYSVGRKKESSIKIQNIVINTILIPHFNEKIISEIKPKDIADLYNKFINKYSKSYLKLIKAILSSMFNYAMSFYDLQKNVVKLVKIPEKDSGKHDGEKVKYWTVDEFNTFIKEIDNPVYKTLFILLFWSGARKGEALALKTSDINIHDHTISINKNWNGEKITTTKNKNSVRVISVPNVVIEHVKELIEHQRNKYKEYTDDFLFTYKNKSTPLQTNTPNNIMKKYLSELELPKIRVHDLRHSNASLLINSGLPLYSISKHLGHNNIQTTANVYGHLYPSSEKEIANTLNKLTQPK